MNITRAAAILLAILSHPAVAQSTSQNPAPLLTPKPVFVPGQYEMESRNSAFQDQPAKGEVCIASADAEAFRRETMAQYQASPQFLKACALSDTRALADRSAFAMNCKESKAVLTFHFAKDLVSSTVQTLVTRRPEYSSEILTLSRRVDECPGQEKSGKDMCPKREPTSRTGMRVRTVRRRS